MPAARNKIIELAKKRVPPASIARTLDCKVDQVYAAIRWARSNGAEIPHFRSMKTETPKSPASSIVINHRLNSLLIREAERLDLSPSEMAQRLLETALLKTVGH